MLLDPESYIPTEVARRSELARKAYRAAAPREPDTTVTLFEVPRLGPRPTQSG